jgi:hypothetical protein
MIRRSVSDVLSINRIQRKLAEITYMMSMDNEGNLEFGVPELTLIFRLLLENFEFVIRTDELNNLSSVAFEANDFDWLHTICQQIEELEAAHACCYPDI